MVGAMHGGNQVTDIVVGLLMIILWALADIVLTVAIVMFREE